jgi:hypothetical protein
MFVSFSLFFWANEDLIPMTQRNSYKRKITLGKAIEKEAKKGHKFRIVKFLSP